MRCKNICFLYTFPPDVHPRKNAPPNYYFLTFLAFPFLLSFLAVAFRIYDMDNDGFISNAELFQVLKMMVGNNLKDTQLQQIVDKTICFADKDEDGKISFEEFCNVSPLQSIISFY